MNLPLAGRRIVVTRPRDQATALGDRLAALGAEVVYCPAFRIAPPDNAHPFQEAIARLSGFEWVALTSVNGVRAFIEETARQGIPFAQLVRLRFACVGPATAEALRQAGLEPSIVPKEFAGTGIADTLDGRIGVGARVLMPRAAGADGELPRRLRVLGAEVTDVVSYQLAADLPNAAEIAALLDADGVDLIVFASPSAATYFMEGVSRSLASTHLAAIGPTTAARLRSLGLEPAITASQHTNAGLVDAIARLFTDKTKRNDAHG